MTLADLGLLPVDTLPLSAQDLADAVTAHALASGASSGPSGHATCRRLAQLLGSLPVVPADLVEDSSQPPDSAVHAELRGRYSAVHAVGTDLQSALRIPRE